MTKSSSSNELIEKTPLGNHVKNVDRLKDAVIQREKEQSTGIGGGIAVAHGKCSEVDSVYIALGISKKGIEFDSFDEQPVHLLLLFSNPPHMASEYLQALSLIMRVLINQPIRRKNAVHKNIKKVKNQMNMKN